MSQQRSTTNRPHPVRPKPWALWILGACIVLALEPALANKFETISGGVVGSSWLKREWLEKFFWISGGISLAFSVLALIVPHSNPLYMNSRTWKQSSIILAVLAAILLSAAYLI